MEKGQNIKQEAEIWWLIYFITLWIIADIFRIYGIKTQIIAASMRTPAYVIGAAKAGSDIATIPYECMKKLFWHPMTDVSLEGFMSDWKKAMGDKKIL